MATFSRIDNRKKQNLSFSSGFHSPNLYESGNIDRMINFQSKSNTVEKKTRAQRKGKNGPASEIPFDDKLGESILYKWTKK